MKIQKKNIFFLGGGGIRVDVNGEGGGVGAWVRGGGQGGWEQRSEACVKIQKKNWGGGGAVGGQGGGEWRSEAFVKIQKKSLRGVGRGRGGGFPIRGWGGGGGVCKVLG